MNRHGVNVILGLHLLGWTNLDDTGIVDENIDSTPLRVNRLDAALNLLGVSDIALECVNIHSAAHELARGFR